MDITQLIQTEEVRKELLAYTRSGKLDHRYVVRSKIILALDEGLSHRAVAKAVDVSLSTVAKWKKRFREAGIDGLLDAPRSGRPVQYSTADRARVIQKRARNRKAGTLPDRNDASQRSFKSASRPFADCWQKTKCDRTRRTIGVEKAQTRSLSKRCSTSLAFT